MTKPDDPVPPEIRERMQKFETGRNAEDDSYYIAATDRTVLIAVIDRAQRASRLSGRKRIDWSDVVVDEGDEAP